MKAIDVAVGIIVDASQSKVLVAQRHTKDQHYGKWEFPGGKINPGESPEQALKRELAEELSIHVDQFKLFDHLTHTYPHSTVNLHFYLVSHFSGLVKGAEGQRIEWVDIKQLNEIDMLDANRTIIKKLQLTKTTP